MDITTKPAQPQPVLRNPTPPQTTAVEQATAKAPKKPYDRFKGLNISEFSQNMPTNIPDDAVTNHKHDIEFLKRLHADILCPFHNEYIDGLIQAVFRSKDVTLAIPTTPDPITHH